MIVAGNGAGAALVAAGQLLALLPDDGRPLPTARSLLLNCSSSGSSYFQMYICSFLGVLDDIDFL
jgi:hypothetical protein